MNQTLATILTIVVTNWVSIGEFTDKVGAKFDVQQGQLQTNTVVDVYWNERLITPTPNRISNRVFLSTNRFILKSVEGPIIGERRIPTVIYATNIYTITNWSMPWPIQQTNHWYLTNTPVSGVDAGIIMNTEDLK